MVSEVILYDAQGPFQQCYNIVISLKTQKQASGFSVLSL